MNSRYKWDIFIEKVNLYRESEINKLSDKNIK